MKKIKQFVIKSNGSALIMTIVLTVMLAAVALMFVAVARMDKAATSNIAANKTLDSAAKSIIELINQQLVYDVPGVAKLTDCNERKFPQYYDYKDYPDACDPWLASIEPYKFSNTDYRWHQITDLTGYLSEHKFPTRNIPVNAVGLNPTKHLNVVKEYPIFGMDPNGKFLSGDSQTEATQGVSADADGDGIADSKWIDISNLRTSTGRVFAAIRIIDNGGMANVNTAYQFNPSEIDANKIDGSSQMQINLDKEYGGLLKKTDDVKNDLHKARTNNSGIDDANYVKKYIHDFNNYPQNGLRPFDSSDELELRYRYCIDSKFKSRLEDVLKETLDSYGDPGGLYNSTDGSDGWGLYAWARRITDVNFPAVSSEIDRRHLLTTYNCDRIIDPCGFKMLNINTADTNAIYTELRKVYPDPNIAAQIAVNIQEYRDEDSDITPFKANDTGKTYYGFESPCIYISEIAYKHVKASGLNPDANAFAIELYKPYSSDTKLDDLSLRVYASGSFDIPKVNVELKSWTSSNPYFLVVLNRGTTLDVNSGTLTHDLGTDPLYSSLTSMFENGDEILLVRHVGAEDIIVDRKVVPGLITTSSNVIKRTERDISPHKCIRRLWQTSDLDVGNPTLGTLGKVNNYISNDANIVQAYPANKKFTNVGQIGMIFKKPAYYTLKSNGADVIGYLLKLEPSVRVDLTDANTQQIFKYLSAMPCSDVNDRVKGRININTAPASVIAQLPWVSQRKNSYNDPCLAKAIVAYRDGQKINNNVGYTNRDPCGFDSIGQLMMVTNNYVPAKNYDIRYYGLPEGDTLGDQKGFPDLSTKSANEGDGAADDFEERDLIFARISDLVTVRSDVFTAYILVRVGTDGPQKRYIAILDRSQVRKPGDKVKIRAFQQVPDAR
jgi:DNA uptake protein ComE-like DNA-binding protein